MIKIEPLGNVVQIEVDEAKAGVLDTSSRTSAVEFGKVIAVGTRVTELKKGDSVFFKSWACDLITHEDKQYVFVNLDTNGIVAKVNVR